MQYGHFYCHSYSFLHQLINLFQVLLDLVQGEFMQMNSDEDESERFSNYLQKTFKKTASLTAYTCKAVSNFTFQSTLFYYY